MIIKYNTFAKTYNELFSILYQSPVDITCRGKSICYEVLNAQLVFDVDLGISIYSHKDTKAFPIKFALAEFVWILAKSNNLTFISKYNKAMLNFSDGSNELYGAYGYRLNNQIEGCIKKLENDIHTRQAFAAIYNDMDIHTVTKDLPCNTSLQFIIRNNRLYLTVNSRSSDFLTGLSIDAFHWQLLLTLVYNELTPIYSGLMIGSVTYNIASLHIYSTDKDIFDSMIDTIQFQSCYNLYDYTIFIDGQYTDVTERAINFVDLENRGSTSLTVYDALDLNICSRSTVNNLYQIFKDRKYKITR